MFRRHRWRSYNNTASGADDDARPSNSGRVRSPVKVISDDCCVHLPTCVILRLYFCGIMYFIHYIRIFLVLLIILPLPIMNSLCRKSLTNRDGLFSTFPDTACPTVQIHVWPVSFSQYLRSLQFSTRPRGLGKCLSFHTVLFFRYFLSFLGSAQPAYVSGFIRVSSTQLITFKGSD